VGVLFVSGVPVDQGPADSFKGFMGAAFAFLGTKTVSCEQLCGSILSNAINTALRLGTFQLSRSVAAHAECDQPVASHKRQQLKVPSAMPQGGWSGTVGLFWCAVGSLTMARQWGSGSVALHELLMSIQPAMHFQNIKPISIERANCPTFGTFLCQEIGKKMTAGGLCSMRAVLVCRVGSTATSPTLGWDPG
jgi:hypothetical protein